MAVGDKLRTMGLLPDTGKLVSMMDDRFRQLTDRLDAILEELRKLNARPPVA